MPVTLVVGELDPITFDAPRVVLGRGESCDLRLPDGSVSSRHASIRARDAGYVVVDEGSTNGTRLNGEKLAAQAPRKLESGDELLLGRVKVTVRIGAARASPPNATRELAMALVARALGDEAERRTTVTVLEGPDDGAKLHLVEGTRTIGRDPRCHLRLTDRAVPPIAVEVTLEGTRARVSLRDERAEVRLGDRVLSPGEPLPWLDGVVLTIGGSGTTEGARLRLDDPIARALAKSSAGEDEKVAIAPPPEPPKQPEPPTEAVPDEAAAADAPPARPRVDRRRTWRGATLAFEVVALILGLLVLGLSAAGFYWLLKK